MRFQARWDGRLRAATVAIVLALSGAAAVLLWLGLRDGDPGAAIVTTVAAAFLGAVVLVSRAFAPVGYALEGDAVKVLRRVRPLVIPLAQVRAAGPIGPVLRGALRMGGSGGLYGWFGRYWSRRLGEFRLQATRLDRLVQLDTPAARFVLSPDPADRFLDEVLARAPGAARVPAEGPHERHPLPRRTWLRLAALVLAAPVLVGAVVIASFGWAPEGVRVDRWSVTVERRWVAPVVIPVATVRTVELLGPGRVGKVRKVTGFVDPRGRAWGTFRAEPLGEFRLYAWTRGPWVLLDTDDGKVVVTPEDPQRFVGEVRAALALRRPPGPPG